MPWLADKYASNLRHDMADESQHQHQHQHQQPLRYTNFSSATDAAMQQGFHPGQDQLYSLQAGMEMMGIAAKAHQSSDAWRASFFPAVAGSSSNALSGGAALNENPAYPWQPLPLPQPNRMPVVDESATRFLFPPSVSSSGLSLSLNHAGTSNAGAAYEAPSLHHSHQVLPANNYSRDHIHSLLQSSAIDPYHHELKSSKFLLPARELLNEFCSLDACSSKHKVGKSNQSWEQEGAAPSSSSTPFNQVLFSLDIHELQGRKAKLLAMLEEVDRRYRRYREQMRAVVLSFEAAAGEGAAAAYSTLASKVMSRHFRCLRDGIAGQIQVIKKAVGEKDAIAPGTSRGETPRLKLIDQHLRQQRTFQQAGVMESHPWRPQRGLPERSVSILRAWLFEHFLHPYPSDVDKHILARQTGLSRSQVSNWFINARVRLWKPMVEEMYLQEKKEQENNQTPSHEENDNSNKLIIYDDPRHIDIAMEDEKPAVAGQPLPDPDSLSWVINNPHARHRMASSSGKSSQLNPNSGENFGVVDLDFASYSQHCGGSRQNFGSGVSLTLGLQQHGGGGGVSLSFSPPASHQAPTPPLLFSRSEEMVDHPGQFTVLDGDQQAQSVAYRNLMGAQLLRDLAG